jgi:hypothetical protein
MRLSRKPSIFINTPLTRKEVKGRIEWVDSWVKAYPNYALLKKALPELLKMSTDDRVTVYRKRRGQWGEWFEKWGYVNGTPQILEEGWM